MGPENNAFTIQSHQFWPIPDWDRNCKGVSRGQNYLLVPVFVRWNMLKGTDLLAYSATRLPFVAKMPKTKHLVLLVRQETLLVSTEYCILVIEEGVV